MYCFYLLAIYLNLLRLEYTSWRNFYVISAPQCRCLLQNNHELLVYAYLRKRPIYGPLFFFLWEQKEIVIQNKQRRQPFAFIRIDVMQNLRNRKKSRINIKNYKKTEWQWWQVYEHLCRQFAMKLCVCQFLRFCSNLFRLQ